MQLQVTGAQELIRKQRDRKTPTATDLTDLN